MGSFLRFALLAAGLSACLTMTPAGCGGPGEDASPPPDGKTAPAGGQASVDEKGATRNAPIGEGIVAVVNGEEISEGEFAGALSAAAFLAKQATFEGRMEVLQGRIDRLLIEQAATDAGVLERPMVIRMIDRTRRRNTAWIARRHLIDQVEITDADVDAAFEEPGELLDLTVLLAESRESAEEALARVEGGEEFADVAKDVSISPGAPAGNVRRLGFERGEGMYPPAVEDTVFALGAGEISGPMETPVGYLVVRLDERRRVTEEEIEKLRTSLRIKLLQRAAESRIREVVDGSGGEGGITILRENFAGDDLPDPDANPAALWRDLEAMEVARVDGTLLTMGDIFRSGMDYQLMFRKTEEGREKPYRSLITQSADRVYLYEYGKEQELDRVPGVEEAVKGFVRNVLVAQYTADIILAVTEESLDMERARAFFDERRAFFLDTEHFDISQIHVRREGDARALLDRVTAGEDFAALAREFSLDGSAAAGGVMDNLSTADLEVIFGSGGVRELIVRGRKGQFEPVLLRTSGGYHLVVIREFNDVGEGDFEDLRERVIPEFLAFSRKEAVQGRRTELRAAADIVIDETKVENVTPAAPPPGSGITPHGGTGGSSRGASPHGGGGGSPHGSGGSPHGGMAPGQGGGGSPHGGSSPSIPLR